MASNEADLHALMQAGLGGDADAHRRLLTALVPVLRRYFRGRVRDVAAVEDLVQDSLIAIHAKRASYDPSRPFAPWFYAVARYKLIDRFRRQRTHLPLDDFEESLGDEGFGDAIGARLDVDMLLDRLPPKQARAIRATKIDQLSVAEAAERSAMSEADVKVSVHRGLKALARLVGRE